MSGQIENLDEILGGCLLTSQPSLNAELPGWWYV
ncbi:hypothetical protein CGRA01v4_01367 [Colletotrichum graminicola]|nr:hypothetical protein CGRA01v4_01367 [Colletotrichum graminicola]